MEELSRIVIRFIRVINIPGKKFFLESVQRSLLQARLTELELLTEEFSDVGEELNSGSPGPSRVLSTESE